MAAPPDVSRDARIDRIGVSPLGEDDEMGIETAIHKDLDRIRDNTLCATGSNMGDNEGDPLASARHGGAFGGQIGVGDVAHARGLFSRAQHRCPLLPRRRGGPLRDSRSSRQPSWPYSCS